MSNPWTLMNINLNLFVNIMNLVTGLSGIIEPPVFLVVHEQPQFHEQGSGTLVWRFMNFSFVVQEQSWIVHEHI